MNYMLGEQGTEQFTVTTEVDRKVIGVQEVHDPFIHTTCVVGIGRWDLFKALFSQQFEVRVNVTLRGSEGIQRAIMMLDPFALQIDTAAMLEDRKISRESYAVSGMAIALCSEEAS